MKGLMILMILVSGLSVTSSFASVSTSGSSVVEEGQAYVADASGAKCDDKHSGKTASNTPGKKKAKKAIRTKKGAVQETKEETV